MPLFRLKKFLFFLILIAIASSATFGSFNANNASINTGIRVATAGVISKSCSGLCPLTLKTYHRNKPFSMFYVRSDGEIIAEAVWTNVFFKSNTGGKGKGPFRLYAQNDGNLVLYDSQNKIIWASNTQQPQALHGPHTLTLTYCDVSLKSPTGIVLWQVNNSQYCPFA